MIAALLAKARTDPAFAAEYQQRVVQPRRDQAREIFGRAMERGEIPAGLDVEVALDLIYGPLYHRLLQGHAPLDDAFVKSAIDLALTGIAPRHARPAAARACREESHHAPVRDKSLDYPERTAADSPPRHSFVGGGRAGRALRPRGPGARRGGRLLRR